MHANLSFTTPQNKLKPIVMFPTKKCQFLVEDPKSPSALSSKSCSLGVK